MVTLSATDAISLVRKNLDEQDPNASVMYDADNAWGDNASLDSVIRRTVPEAVNAVNRMADSRLLEGVAASVSGASVSGDVLSFSISQNILRIVAFQAADSPVVLGDWVEEYSPEGRKQLDPYVRGTWDDPRLVKVQGGAQSFRYYSLKPGSGYSGNPASAVGKCLVVPEQTLAESYNVALLLREPTILHLTGMVCSIYGEFDKAKYFFEKAGLS